MLNHRFTGKTRVAPGGQQEHANMRAHLQNTHVDVHTCSQGKRNWTQTREVEGKVR